MNNKTVPCGFTVVIDDREKLPYQFAALRATVRQGGGLLYVPTVRRRLEIGDYSIEGHEHDVAIERKSLEDLYQSVVRRDNFVGRLEQMNNLRFAAVVVEATWLDVATAPPFSSQMNPLSVVRSMIAWTVRFPRVHWIPAGGRAEGEAITFRLLEAYNRDQTKWRRARRRGCLSPTEVPLSEPSSS
jgi:ERCC4-type nuclease